MRRPSLGAQVSTRPLAALVPEFDLFSLPHLFRDDAHSANVVNGLVGAHSFKLLQAQDIQGWCWFYDGYGNIFNTKRPMRERADLKGLKIRVLAGPLMIDTLNNMGASATLMAYGRLYAASAGVHLAPDTGCLGFLGGWTRMVSVTTGVRTPPKPKQVAL